MSGLHERDCKTVPGPLPIGQLLRKCCGKVVESADCVTKQWTGFYLRYGYYKGSQTRLIHC